MRFYCLGSGQMEDTLRFGIKILEDAFREKGITLFREKLSMLLPGCVERALAVKTEPSDGHSAEGFSITKSGELIVVTGYGAVGAMYGLFEIAEAVRLYGFEHIEVCAREPFMQKRGVKFNLPFQPYADGDIFQKNKETVKDMMFWRSYIDFLALNRYNCLSLWSENPFEYMVDIAKYPNASDYSTDERRKMRELFTEIFAHAKSRGMEIFIITWNIRISPGIAGGLGLPEELGERDHDRRSIGLRQHNETIKDYFREAVKTLVLSYPDLTGIGTSNSEEMTGSPAEREEWVAETYLAALSELGHQIPFIHRTNQSSGVIAQEMFLNNYKCDEKYVSWKYSNAHMYSHPRPQFEDIFDAWGEMDLSGIKVLYTVRNDDFHNLRGCDPAFIAEYIRGMKRPYVDGFYWGADGYMWAGEHQHFPDNHIQWNYAFEKHWMQFEMIGRIAYDPDVPKSIWEEKFIQRYGKAAGPALYNGLCAGVRLLCAVNRLYWINYDYQWHPETLLCTTGFKSIYDFMDGRAMPGVGVMGMSEYIEVGEAGANGRETPAQILEIIRRELAVIEEAVSIIDGIQTCSGDMECVAYDVKGWYSLGSYYHCKLRAAMELLYYKLNVDTRHKEKAVLLLEEALIHWEKLSYIGSQHYLPYYMARVRQMFGWSYYIAEVKQDIERAKAL